MEPQLIILTVSFFCIAAVYSSVGFGGGSSYLALLAVMGVHFEIIRPAALLCNIVVVAGGTFIFWRSGAVDMKKSWPFLTASVPLAFAGGLWPINDAFLFFTVLGICLIAASILLWIQPTTSEKKNRFNNVVLNASLGGVIGFLSGFVGIGGGIFLAPALHLLRWGEAKKISALASVFILANSASALAGQLAQSQSMDWAFVAPLLIAVFIGGQIGSRLGARKFDPVYIKRITSIVIFLAAIKILDDQF